MVLTRLALLACSALAATILGAPSGVDGPCPGTTLPHRVYNTLWSTLDAEYAVFAERLPDGD